VHLRDQVDDPVTNFGMLRPGNPGSAGFARLTLHTDQAGAPCCRRGGCTVRLCPNPLHRRRHFTKHLGNRLDPEPDPARHLDEPTHQLDRRRDVPGVEPPRR